MHLLSPIPLDIMEKVLDKLDTYIAKYNREKRTFIRDIQGATASYPAGISQEENTYDRIAPFPERATKDAYDIAAQGKLEYVEKWIRGINNLDFCIYAGNGRNDFRAIDYIRKNSRGYSICPDNSRKAVKKIATFTSENTDIEGIIDGLDRLNQYLIQKIEMRIREMNDSIIIKGAKEHNLKNINLTIPRDKLVVITGLSGSRKIFSCL